MMKHNSILTIEKLAERGYDKLSLDNSDFVQQDLECVEVDEDLGMDIVEEPSIETMVVDKDIPTIISVDKIKEMEK